MAPARSDSRLANEGGSKTIKSNFHSSSRPSQSKASAWTEAWRHRATRVRSWLSKKFLRAPARAWELRSRSVTEEAPPRAAYNEKPPEKLNAFNTLRPL